MDFQDTDLIPGRKREGIGSVICDYLEVVSSACILPESSLHVCRVSLDVAVGDCDWDIRELIEPERAYRFRKETNRDRFVVCRSALRRILRSCLEHAPERFFLESLCRRDRFQVDWSDAANNDAAAL
jgi:hypothetical protein